MCLDYAHSFRPPESNMWARLFLCFLVAGICAGANHGWKVGNQYEYIVRGRTLAALHDVADQYNGVLFRAKLHIQPEDDVTLNARIIQAQQAEVHQRLPDGWDSTIDESTISFQPLTLADEPFQIKFQNGVVRKLIVSGKLRQSEVNLIKSVVSQFQVDTKGENLVRGSDAQLPTESNLDGAYEVMEDSVTGKCNVQYSVSEPSRYIVSFRPFEIFKRFFEGRLISIVKTSNFSDCEDRPEYHFGLNGHHKWKPASTMMGQFFSRSSVSNILIKGHLNKYAIQSSVTTSKAIISPALYNAQKGMVVSRMNVTLASVESARNTPQQPTEPVEQKDLVYSYEPAIVQHSQPQTRKPRMFKDDDDSSVEITLNSPFAELSDVQSDDSSIETSSTLPELDQSVSMLLYPDFLGNSLEDKQKVFSLVHLYAKQIGMELQQPNEIPSKATLAKFTVLSSLIRSLDLAHLNSLTKDLYPKMTENEKDPAVVSAWRAYRDAVVEAGTGPAFLAIKEWILKDLVKGQEAAELMAALPESARLPSMEYLKAFFKLAINSKVRQEQYLNSTAILSFAELVRLAQVDEESAHARYPSHIFRDLNSRTSKNVVGDFITYFKDTLQSAVQQGDSVRIQTFIRVLGNFGHPQIVDVFEPYLFGTVRVTNFQRLAMVVAMNQLTKVYPEVARNALFRIYQNVAEDPQVRAAAVALLMKTNPPPNVLQRMAEFTKDEHNPHIRAVVKSAIESAAHLKSWDSWELTTHGKAAEFMLNTSDVNARLSQTFLRSYDVKDIPLAYRASFTSIGSQDSFTPQGALLSIRQNFGDFKLNAEGVGILTSSISDMMLTIANQFEESKSWTKRNSAPFRTSFGWSIKDILSELNITHDSSEPIEANMLLKSMAGKRFFAWDNSALQQLPYDLQKAAEELREGKNFNYTKLYNQYSVSMSFPTATGFPFYYSLSAPTLLHLDGKTRVIVNPQPTAEKLTLPKTLNATFDFHAVASSKIQAEIGFINPLTFHRYTAGVDKDMQVNFPIQAQIDMEFRKENERNQFMEMRAKVRPTETEGAFQIAVIRNRPYTATQNMYKPAALDQHIIHIRRPHEANFTIGQQLTGMAFRVDAATERQFDDFADVYHQIRKNDFVSLMTFLTKEKSIFNYEYALSFDHHKSPAKSVTFTAAMETFSKKTFDENDRYAEVQRQEEEQQQQQLQGQTPQAMFTSYMLRPSETISGEAAPKAVLSRPIHNPAKPSDTTANSHQRRKEFLRKTTQKITDAEAVVIDLSATFKGQTRAEFVATTAMSMSEVSDDRHALVYLRKKSADQQEGQLALAAELKIPRVPLANFLNAMKTQPDVFVRTSATFGQELDASASQVDGMARLHRTQAQLDHVRRSPMAKLCVDQMHRGDYYLPACQNATLNVNKLNNYDVSVAYERISEYLQNATYKAYSLARDFGWQFNSESVLGVKNEQNQVTLKARFDHEYEAVNVSIAAPTFNSHFENIRLDRMVAAAVVAHPVFRPSQMLGRELFHRDVFPICTVAQTAVNTFSNKTFPVKLGKNWHVVFASAYKKGAPTEKYNDLVIMTRETISSEHQKEAVILAGPNVIELTYARDYARVNVNGNTIKVSERRTNSFSDEHHNTWTTIYGRPDGSVKILLPVYDSKILYDRNSLIIEAGSQFRDQARGLCGLFNDEEASDFTAPRNCVLKEAKDFAASYIFRPTGTAANDQERAKNAKCVSRHYSFGNLRFDESIEDQQNSPSAGCVDFKVKVMEQDGKTCFSKRPQPTCSSDCQPHSEIEKKVEFACASEPEATQWKKHIRMSSFFPSHLARSATTKMVTIRVPESCQP